jgi:LacI family transcriptional regulator
MRGTGDPVKRPTIKDVARTAGCSLSTVSLVVNNRGYVSEELRQRVLKVVEDLGYHPTRSARGLASKTSGNLGFILREDHFSRAEPFYTRVFLGAEFAARDLKYYLLLTTVASRFTEDDLPRFLHERNVDGVIIAGKVDLQLLERIDHFGLPVLLVDFEVKRKRYPAVLIDNRGGAHAAVTYLLSLGHREIGFVGGDMEHPSLAERLLGYRETLAEFGIKAPASLIQTSEMSSDSACGERAMARLLKERPFPTAVFAANDAMALGCMQAIRKAGLRVPDDISIVGFDDVETSILVQPRLTTVRVRKEELGRHAVEQLAGIILKGSTHVTTTHVPVELIVRESSGSHILPTPAGEALQASNQ